MTYLLDVNALVALGFMNHEFHDRVARWVRSQREHTLATCSITELGFARVLAQAPAYGFTVTQARALLLRMKEARAPRFVFIADQHDLSQLPAWVKTPRQITDGHLAKLASANGAVLATLDEKIPGAWRIAR
ncbi:MAG TPA: PIN domain-containing protein [Terriglobales bacterium]